MLRASQICQIGHSARAKAACLYEIVRAVCTQRPLQCARAKAAPQARGGLYLASGRRVLYSVLGVHVRWLLAFIVTLALASHLHRPLASRRPLDLAAVGPPHGGAAAAPRSPRE